MPSSSRSCFGDPYRAVPEDRIVEMLALAGWACEPGEDGGRASAREVLRGWCERGLKHRVDGQGVRRFDPAEVWATMKAWGRAGDDRFFADRYVATGRRLVRDLSRAASADGPFELEIVRTVHRTADRRSDRGSRLSLALPLASAHPDLEIQVLESRAKLTAGPARLDVRHPPSETPISFGARLRFAAPRPASDQPTENQYLHPREPLVVVTPRIADLAQTLAPRGTRRGAAIRAFCDFLIAEFLCAPVHYDQIDPAAPCDWVLDHGLYDCRLGAALFVALCRARDIPARLVGGHLLYRQAPTNHFWAEYWDGQDGWRPVDFLGWDLSAGGRDIAWRDRLFGQVDARAIFERLPFAFAPPSGAAVPPRWQLLQSAAPGGGVDIALTTFDGTPVLTDRVTLREAG